MESFLKDGMKERMNRYLLDLKNSHSLEMVLVLVLRVVGMSVCSEIS